jgi:hypothetical protein
MAYFQTKIPLWVNFDGSRNGRCWCMYFMAIWSVVRTIDIFCGHLVYFTVIWYTYYRLGMLYQDKSGNPA